MNKERVQLLVEALRSGEYKQGFTLLCHNNCYCIWGVGYEVAMANGLDIRKGTPGGMVTYDGFWSNYSEKLLDWYGITKQFADYLMSCNDYGTNFDDLAAILEKHLGN